MVATPMMAATSRCLVIAPSSRSIEPHRRNVLLDRHSGPIALRKSIDPCERALRDFAAGEHRPAALRARAAMAEIERIEAHGDERALAKLAFGGEPFPELRRGREAATTAVGARVEEVGGRRLMRQAEALVGLGRKHLDGVVLEDEVAEAVEDRTAAIDLDPER